MEATRYKKRNQLKQKKRYSDRKWTPQTNEARTKEKTGYADPLKKNLLHLSQAKALFAVACPLRRVVSSERAVSPSLSSHLVILGAVLVEVVGTLDGALDLGGILVVNTGENVGLSLLHGIDFSAEVLRSLTEGG